MINLEEKTKVKTDPDELTPYLDAGYPMLPLHHWADQTVLKDGKILERGKTPLDKEWTGKTFDSEEMLRHMRRGNNVGVQLRKTDLIIDVDPRNDTRKENEPPSLQRFLQDVGLDEADDIPRVETGGGGLHLYFTKPENLAVVGKLDAYPGIEFKTYGQQVVAAGSVHPKTGNLYKWDPLDCNLMRAPKAPQRLLEMIEKKPSANALVPVAGLFTEEETETVLSNLDVMKFHHKHDDWLRLMMACHHASGGSAEDAFVSWSLGDPEYAEDEEMIRNRWQSLTLAPQGRAVTFKTLRYFLKEVGKEAVLQQILAKKDFSDLEADYDVIAILAAEGCIEKLVEEMNKTIAAVLLGKDYVILVEDKNVLSGRPEYRFLSKKGFFEYYDNCPVFIPDQNGRLSKKSCAQIWHEHPNRRSYKGVFMHPQKPEEVDGKINLWKGWGVTPALGDWSLMKELIHRTLCAGNDELYDYVLKWIALMLQRPWVRPEVALVFRGKEGTGKGTLGRALLKITGRQGLTVTSPKHLMGSFNAHLMNTVFLFADEAFFFDNKSHMGNLKAMLTEPSIMYEQKGLDAFLGENFLHILMASNEDKVVPVGPESRRFCFIDVSDNRRKDFSFFTALNQQMENGGHEAMAYDLLHMDIEGWHPSHKIPKTKALADQAIEALSPAEKWLLEMVTMETLPIDDEKAKQWETGSVCLYSKEKERLLKAYHEYLQDLGLNDLTATHKAIFSAAKKFGAKKGMHWLEGRYWILPPREEMRRTLAEYLGDPDMFD